MDRNDVINILALFLLIGALILVVGYFLLNDINSCTSDPLGYSVEMFKEKYSMDLVYGTIYASDNKGFSTSVDFGDINISYGGK